MVRTYSYGARAAAVALLVMACGAALRAQQVAILRDPQTSVFTAFPEATAYRTIVRQVDRDARLEIESALPFDLHFHELGAHGLYVALRGKQPVGLLYLRSEESEWGVAEIVWAMTLDLRITGFQLQRCRSRRLLALRRSEFSRSLRGADRAELQLRLGAAATTAGQQGGVPPSDRGIAAAVVRSAMISLAVTEVVWGAEVEKLWDLGMGLEVFPTGEGFRRLRMASPPAAPGGAGAGAVAIEARAVLAQDVRGRVLGFAAWTADAGPDKPLVLRWKIGAAGQVLAVAPSAAWPVDETRAACFGLVGRPLPATPVAGDRVRAAAFRLQQMIMAHRRGSGR